MYLWVKDFDYCCLITDCFVFCCWIQMKHEILLPSFRLDHFWCGICDWIKFNLFIGPFVFEVLAKIVFFLIGVCWIERSIRTLQIRKSFDALWIVTILKWSFYLIRTCSGTLIWDGTNRCQHINNWRDFELRIYCKHQSTYCK